MQNQSLFFKIDSYLFKQVELIKSNPEYQKISSKYEALPTKTRKLVNKLLVITFVGFPVFIVFILFILNMLTKSDVSLYQEIINKAEHVQNLQKESSSINQNLMSSNGPLKSENDLNSKVQSILLRNNAQQIKSQITQFQANNIGEISKITATIQLPSIGLAEFNAVIAGLLNQEKLGISGLNIKKNKETATLSASIVVNQLSKSQ